MTIGITVTYRNSKTTLLTQDRVVADAEWNTAKKSKDVVCVTGGIVCCVVSLGSGRYTYLCNELYSHGTKVIVPTPYGNKIVPVLYSDIVPKQNLERIAIAKNSTFNDFYKEIIGTI